MAARSPRVLATGRGSTNERWPNNCNEVYWQEQDDVGWKVVGSNHGANKVFDL